MRNVFVSLESQELKTHGIVSVSNYDCFPLRNINFQLYLYENIKSYLYYFD